jgi:hypothetical protein
MLSFKKHSIEAAELSEKLKATDKMGDWVKDFQDSDAPQFKGKSKEKKREMAVAAKLGAEREAGMREDVEHLEENPLIGLAIRGGVALARGAGRTIARNPGKVAIGGGIAHAGSEIGGAVRGAADTVANAASSAASKIGGIGTAAKLGLGAAAGLAAGALAAKALSKKSDDKKKNEEVEINEGRNEAAAALEKLAKTGGMDKKDFQKAHDLYKAAKLNDLKKLIASLDTEPSEAIASAISRHDSKTFNSMYPKAKAGEYIRKIVMNHESASNKADELSESDINEITAQYINENNITLEQLENMTEEELNELIGKAIGGAFKIGAKTAVGAFGLAKKAANRMSTSGRADAAEKRADALEKRNKDRKRIEDAKERAAEAKRIAAKKDKK